MRFATFAFERCARPELQPDRGRRRLGGRQFGHRLIDRGPGRVPIGRGGRRARRGRVPAGVHREQERLGQFVRARLPRFLLFGLGGQPAGLWAQFAQDVLGASEVRL